LGVFSSQVLQDSSRDKMWRKKHSPMHDMEKHCNIKIALALITKLVRVDSELNNQEDGCSSINRVSFRVKGAFDWILRQGISFLVYEYIENGNLGQYLHGTGREPLAWSTRVQIALDSARGLEYIREHIVPVYIHHDVKPANILIYKDFREKVANFGLTKLRKVGSSLSLHTCLVGTFGYMPLVGSECFNQLKVVTVAAPTILLAIKSK
ncbi:hypothetical protein HN873_055576, partial [Arachis hypogaea]